MSMHRVVVLTLVALVSLAGVPASTASAQGTVELPMKDVKARKAVERTIAQAAAKGLPVQPLLAKAMEGVTKHATGELIQAAVASLAQRLEQAQTLLAPSPSAAEVISGADALGVGVPGEMLTRIRATWPKERSVAMPLDVLTELTARNVPVEHAVEQITSLMARGATPAQIAGLGNAHHDRSERRERAW